MGTRLTWAYCLNMHTASLQPLENRSSRRRKKTNARRIAFTVAGERGASSKKQHHPVEEWGVAFSRARIGDWCSSSSVPPNESPRRRRRRRRRRRVVVVARERQKKPAFLGRDAFSTSPPLPSFFNAFVHLFLLFSPFVETRRGRGGDERGKKEVKTSKTRRSTCACETNNTRAVSFDERTSGHTKRNERTKKKERMCVMRGGGIFLKKIGRSEHGAPLFSFLFHDESRLVDYL